MVRCSGSGAACGATSMSTQMERHSEKAPVSIARPSPRAIASTYQAASSTAGRAETKGSRYLHPRPRASAAHTVDNHTRSRQQALTDLHRQHALERPVEEEAQNLGRRKARVVSGSEARPGTAHRTPRRRDQTYLWTSPARKKRDAAISPCVHRYRSRAGG